MVMALLSIFSRPLVRMTGEEIKDWFGKIRSGEPDWYHLLPLSVRNIPARRMFSPLRLMPIIPLKLRTGTNSLADGFMLLQVHQITVNACFVV
jgi:hypothetical protein